MGNKHYNVRKYKAKYVQFLHGIWECEYFENFVFVEISQKRLRIILKNARKHKNDEYFVLHWGSEMCIITLF